MAISRDDPGALRELIGEALSIADARMHHLVAALLAQCLEQLGEPEPKSEPGSGPCR